MDCLIDSYHRRINYLRLSLTDRCNLRCRYCMPPEGVTKFEHEEILRYEEILRFVRLAVRKGIQKIRLTGGEPLVRKGILPFIRELSALPGIQDLSLTTNGLLLPELADPLRRAGLKRVNISMDSLHPEKYREITGGGNLSQVWAGIEAAKSVGISPIKINVVAIAGFNDKEIFDFAALTMNHPFQVRFIEFMPFGGFWEWKKESWISCDEIRQRIEARVPLIPAEQTKNSHDGPARLFRFPQAKGEIGFISPISNHFCDSCNRLRLTADGKLRTCLFAEEEIDIRKLLRQGCSDRQLEAILEEAILRKPLRRRMIEGSIKSCSRPMVQIGG
jgi:cyclic pyranopterin phosphate synthase